MSDMNIDSIISRLLEGLYLRVLRNMNVTMEFTSWFFWTVRGARPGKNVQLSESEIRGLCLKSREIFLSQPILLELEAPLKICGKLKDVRLMQRHLNIFWKLYEIS